MPKPTPPNQRGAAIVMTYDHVRPDVKAPADDPDGALDSEPERAGTLEGRVVDAKGVAVPDAMVLLLNVEHKSSTESTTQPATIQTDPEGRFRFESLGTGPWLATAAGPVGEAGHGGGAHSGLIRLQGDEVRTIELVLGHLDRVSGVQVAGTVTDPQGRPLADAEVTITVSTGAPGPSSSSAASSRGSTTDSRGRFEIPGLPHGSAILVATHAEYRDAVHEFAIDPEPNQVSLTLEPGLEIAGSIRSSSGEAIPLARIVAIPDLFADRWPGSSGMVEAQADRNGDYRLKGLNAGVYELTASAEGYAKSDFDETVRLDDRSAAGVGIVLVPEARVTVCVTGVSRTGFRVHAVQGNAFREAQSTEAGEYRIGSLPPGNWVVSAVDVDDETVQQAVALSPGDDVVVELHFEPGVLLTGQITVAGRTVEGGTLALNRAGGTQPRWSHMDRRGHFEVPGLQPGIYFAMIAVPTGAAYRRRIELRENRHLRLDLEAQARLTGRVVNAETGEPLAEAFVATLVDLGLDQPLPGSMARTTADGRFELRPAPGANEIVVNSVGFEEQRMAVQLAPAERREGLVFESNPGGPELAALERTWPESAT
ncbi:MAG: hypothetical protein F4X59_09640 [Holophagales bacterium]|nr:hypothetical protein [Holophagales bacterium]MYC10377.1 hypothetical protein [Holophagales bacterium]